MKSPSESTRAFPNFNVISLAGSKKLPKFIKDGRHVDLIWMGLDIEYLLGRMNGVGDDDDFRDVFFAASLANTTSVKIVNNGLIFYFLFSLYFSFLLLFLFFSIFRTTRVRVYRSRRHISHKTDHRT